MMNSIRNILLPTDFSPNSEKALFYAIDLVKKNRGSLLLLHVIDLPFITSPQSQMDVHKRENMTNVADDVRTLVRNKLEHIVKEKGLPDTSYRCLVREGNIEEEVLEVAKLNDTDLVIMGTRGGGSEKKILMGSVTRGVMQQLHCPVLAVPEAAGFSDISEIVYATDLEDDETNMINYLISFAQPYDAAITILRIKNSNINPAVSIEHLKDRVEPVYPKIDYMEIAAKNVTEGINQFIERQNADVLALTTRTVSLYDKLFHSSLTKQMLYYTRIPLMIFKRKKYDTIFLG